MSGAGYALWPEKAKTIPEHEIRALHPQQPLLNRSLCSIQIQRVELSALHPSLNRSIGMENGEGQAVETKIKPTLQPPKTHSRPASRLKSQPSTLVSCFGYNPDYNHYSCTSAGKPNLTSN
jgi:hypothetical protein